MASRFSLPHLCESVLVHVRQAEETRPLDVRGAERDRGPGPGLEQVAHAGAPAQSKSCSAQRLHTTSERPLKLQPLSSLFGPGREGSRNATGGQKGSTNSKTCFTTVNELMSKRPQSEAYALTLQMTGRSFTQTITGEETAPLQKLR